MIAFQRSLINLRAPLLTADVGFKIDESIVDIDENENIWIIYFFNHLRQCINFNEFCNLGRSSKRLKNRFDFLGSKCMEAAEISNSALAC